MNSFNKIKILLPSLFIAMLFTACGIPSVHPLYEPGDLISDSRLNGTWKKTNNDSWYDVMSVADLIRALENPENLQNFVQFRSYNDDGTETSGFFEEDDLKEFIRELAGENRQNLYLVQRRDEPSTVYLAGLVRIAGNHYLDFFKVSFDLGQFSYPVHIFTKVTISADQLDMHMFSEAWLKQLIENRQVRIKHEVNDVGNFLLTAPTRDLQKFVEKYGEIPEAYTQTDTWNRISSIPTFTLSE